MVYGWAFSSCRKVLEDECDQYRQDIAFLQGCLYGEHDFITAAVEEDMKPQPTLQGTGKFKKLIFYKS